MRDITVKGGKGSGHFGHGGRPGKRGGSLPGKLKITYPLRGGYTDFKRAKDSKYASELRKKVEQSLEYGKKYSSLQEKEDLDEFADILMELPKDVIERFDELGGIVITNDPQDIGLEASKTKDGTLSRNWREQYDFGTILMDTYSAFYNTETKRIVIITDSSKSSRYPSALFHEIGHLIYYSARNKYVDGWDEKWEHDPTFDKRGIGSKRDVFEGFAVTFEGFVFSGGSAGSKSALKGEWEEVWKLILNR